MYTMPYKTKLACLYGGVYGEVRHIVGATRTPRDKWIEEGLQALAAGGPDAVRVEALAKKLGVTKGGFYGSFADRDALLEAMLDAWERESTDEVIDRVEREGGDPRTKIQRAGVLTFSSDRLLPIDLAIRDWARRDEAVAERLRRVDNRRMALLREMIGTFCSDADEVEARSLLAFCVAIGEHFLAADHGDRTRAQVLVRAADLLLKRPIKKRPRPLTRPFVEG
jgi:AcrR family transcriptional regulator